MFCQGVEQISITIDLSCLDLEIGWDKQLCQYLPQVSRTTRWLEMRLALSRFLDLNDSKLLVDP